MSEKSGAKKKQGKRPFAGLKGIHVPDGVPCPDCSAIHQDNKLIHDDTCPTGSGLDRITNMDRIWFEENPGETQYVREVTQAEILSVQVTGEDDPGLDWSWATHVLVMQIAPSLRLRRPCTLVLVQGQS
jgi:hypothetical protein